MTNAICLYVLSLSPFIVRQPRSYAVCYRNIFRIERLEYSPNFFWAFFLNAVSCSYDVYFGYKSSTTQVLSFGVALNNGNEWELVIGNLADCGSYVWFYSWSNYFFRKISANFLLVSQVRNISINQWLLTIQQLYDDATDYYFLHIEVDLLDRIYGCKKYWEFWISQFATEAISYHACDNTFTTVTKMKTHDVRKITFFVKSM